MPLLAYSFFLVYLSPDGCDVMNDVSDHCAQLTTFVNSSRCELKVLVWVVICTSLSVNVAH